MIKIRKSQKQENDRLSKRVTTSNSRKEESQGYRQNYKPRRIDNSQVSFQNLPFQKQQKHVRRFDPSRARKQIIETTTIQGNSRSPNEDE